MSQNGSLIIMPDDLLGLNTPYIQAKIINRDRVTRDAAKALVRENLFMKVELALVETPMGFILVDQEGGHLPYAFDTDGVADILICDIGTGLPIASCPAKIRELLTYCDLTMPIAEFINNQDGNEKRWVNLVVSMVACGLDTKKDEDYRRKLNAKRMILGGSKPFDRKDVK